MNTIFVSGTVRIVNDIHIEYEVCIWAAEHSQDLALVTQKTFYKSDYNKLWTETKLLVEQHFNNPMFQDGGYTNYLEHLITLTSNR